MGIFEEEFTGGGGDLTSVYQFSAIQPGQIGGVRDGAAYPGKIVCNGIHQEITVACQVHKQIFQPIITIPRKGCLCGCQTQDVDVQGLALDLFFIRLA